MHASPRGHTDHGNHTGANTIVEAALARGVPVIAASRMLEWLDGRNGSSFDSVEYSGDQLRFTITRAPGATGLRAMVPIDGPGGPLRALRYGGAEVETTTLTVKGVRYAVFDAAAGDYTGNYAAPKDRVNVLS